MATYSQIQQELRQHPRKWLVTGAAGFIGSHLVETLLSLSQHVVGLDSFITGSPANLKAATATGAGTFDFIEGDICDPNTCAKAVKGVDIILHQAALGSVPRSIAEPRIVHEINVDGFMNMLLAAKDAGINRFVYASSSACYGDSETLPKREGEEGKQLSPYAATKTINDVYAQVFAHSYGMKTIGLRYFNVFGPRQDPNGPYAAVVPLWMNNLTQGIDCYINGDGKTSRDFCYIANVVQANIIAGLAPETVAGEVINVAVGDTTTLTQLFDAIRDAISKHHPQAARLKPHYRAFREGDIRHSLADISKAKNLLGYAPTHSLAQGLQETAAWYVFQQLPNHG